jgi:wobble nucleotide-excising tRNase
MLEKFLKVSHLGRFHYLHVGPGTALSRCTLIFGENGWGKSTLADLLRAVSLHSTTIMMGRQALGAGVSPSVALLFDKKPANFDDGKWSGARPEVAVFDSAFINDNVFSGDIVERTHLTRQASLVLGDKGVLIARRIAEIDKEAEEIPASIKQAERAISTALRAINAADVRIEWFCGLQPAGDFKQEMADRQRELAIAEGYDKLRTAADPEDYPVPTSAADFATVLTTTIKHVSADALGKVRAHIARHDRRTDDEGPSHEEWLVLGHSFENDDDCPYCGQALNDRSLVSAYAAHFSEQFEELGDKARVFQQTCDRYRRGEYGNALRAIRTKNSRAREAWKSLANEELPVERDITEAVARLENAADGWGKLFEQKLADLSSDVPAARFAELSAEWSAAREEILAGNKALADTRAAMNLTRRNSAGADIPELKSAIGVLKVKALRADAKIIELVSEKAALEKKRNDIANQKKGLRDELKTHAGTITTTLQKRINHFLDRLNAGFAVEYQLPDFKGKEPAASYHYVINKTAVQAKSSINGDEPSFRNTLSAGDKSTLALALFLATVNDRPNLADTIVVLDDPFTSLDEFRRTFTANEIFKLSKRAKQVIVFSHDKSFLRLLWERLGKAGTTSLAVQAGAKGISSLNVFDIEAATTPRDLLERQRVIDFLEGGDHQPEDIRKLLRPVLEEFYRKADGTLFPASMNLDGIITTIRNQPDGYRFKAALEDLELINAHTRVLMHAKLPGNPHDDSSDEERKRYCRMTIELTRGM